MNNRALVDQLLSCEKMDEIAELKRQKRKIAEVERQKRKKEFEDQVRKRKRERLSAKRKRQKVACRGEDICLRAPARASKFGCCGACCIARLGKAANAGPCSRHRRKG